MKSGLADSPSNQLSHDSPAGSVSECDRWHYIDAFHVIRKGHGFGQADPLTAIAFKDGTLFHDALLRYIKWYIQASEEVTDMSTGYGGRPVHE
jgi:hypothetical protein